MKHPYNILQENVISIAKSCGRNPKEIQIIAATKNQSIPTLQSLYNAGCHQMGENRVQEALEKMPNLPKDINWHFIGTLQKKKSLKS